MILMSKYKGTWWEKKDKKIRARPSPSLFGQCPKEIDFYYGRCSLTSEYYEPDDRRTV